MASQSPQFASEAAFEDAVIQNLTELHGWSRNVLNYPTQQDLVNNWADIIFENNNSLERLNNVPLSDSETQTLVQEIGLRSKPVEVHRLLQGKLIPLKRDNPADKRNHGKDIFLKIFDPAEVAGGDSTYQIARQPMFAKTNPVDRDRRGDFVLLIWGLPLIHVELKNSSHSHSEAVIQIQRYMDQSVFTGLLNAIQVFVALTPDDLHYFARPNDADSFNSNFQFEWSAITNESYTDWRQNVSTFLGIPHAHQLIGDYLITDRGDNTLKVLRPYQIYAVRSIIRRLQGINRLDRDDWSRNTQKGGYVWHTTGSGKTMTSFKAATLLARQNLADKVIFVLDRIELGDQSMREYENFSDASIDIHKPRNAWALLRDLKDTHKTLLLTSLHKLGDLCSEDSEVDDADFERIQLQRVVFVVDEAHRSTFGEMFRNVKKRFPHAVFIGFTGTPIHDENKRKDTITSTLFGDELHRYSIYYGLRDGNVLGFETVPIDTLPGLREKVALREAQAASVEEVMADENKLAVYDRFMDPAQVPWVTYSEENGRRLKGIEELAGKENWRTEKHREAVVDYINEHWAQRSRGGKLHAMFAADSVMEAIYYYRLFKERTTLRVTAVFTDADEHTHDAVARDRGIREILTDYNTRYNQSFSRKDLADFKTDVSYRLAHKDGYRYIADDPEEQIDLVVVVDQLLTGYDSKWVNTLYLDRVLTYDRLVQAFSRTNRVLNSHLKPFGSIIYFRMVHTMERNIEEAFDLYSGNQAQDLFVDPLPRTLLEINSLFEKISTIFADAGVPDFERLPQDNEARRKFAVAFSDLTRRVESALIQGFDWGKLHYDFPEYEEIPCITVLLDEQTYGVLLSRYDELSSNGGEEAPGSGSIPLDLSALAIAREAQRIDYQYMDAKFEKFREALKSAAVSQQELQELLWQVQSAYAALSQDDQEIAQMILTDIQVGRLNRNEDKTFRDYLNEYKADKQDINVQLLHEATGIPFSNIRHVLDLSDGTEETLTAFNRLKNLQEEVDYELFNRWLKDVKGLQLIPFDQMWAAEQLLREFFHSGGIDPSEWNSTEFDS